MKKLTLILAVSISILLAISCTKTESEFNDNTVTAIALTASNLNVAKGSTVNFAVTSNTGAVLNSNTLFYVNDIAINGNSYAFLEAGVFTIKASYQSLFSNLLTVTVGENPVAGTAFVNRVLVEEYSGTWCGNCPRILYGIDLLEQQTDKAVVVGIHLFGNDPFICNDGNNLANSQGVSGVPSGKINRTTNWSGPQYQNVNQVTGQIKSASNLGLGINSTNFGNTLNLTVTVGLNGVLPANSELNIYLVEDNLFHTQANYSSNLYGGLSSIPNFKYNGVLRGIITTINGESINFTGAEFQKNYNYTLPSNVINNQNLRLVAFVTSNSGGVENVQEARIGQNQILEKIN